MKRIRIAITLVLALVWFSLLGPRPLGGPASYILVSGISMRPTLESGDLAILRRHSGYQAGDIVAFPAPGAMVIHRIIGGSGEEGYILQGDNRNEPDDWHPRADEVLGKMWLRVPGAGRLIAGLQAPSTLALLAAGLAMAVVGKPAEAERAGRRRRRPKAADVLRPVPSTYYDQVLGVLALCGLLCALCVALIVYTNTQPWVRSESVERTRYTHHGDYDYTVHLLPSELYAGDVLSPADAPRAENEEPRQGPEVPARLARDVNLAFTYRIDGPEADALRGEASAQVVVRAGETWSKVLRTLPAVPLEGGEARLSTAIDVGEVISLTQIIEEQTGYASGYYQVALVPRVRVWGREGEASADVFETEFAIDLLRDRIRLGSELEHEEARTVSEPVTVPNAFSVLGRFELPVMTAYVLGLRGALISGAIALIVGAWVLWSLWRDPAARIAARYGGLLVPVDAIAADDVRRIDVRAIDALVRVARHSGQPVLHHETEDEHLYLVSDGPNLYRYRLSKGRKEA